MIGGFWVQVLGFGFVLLTFGKVKGVTGRGTQISRNFGWGKTLTSLRGRSQKGQHSTCGQTVDKKPTQTRANAHFFSYVHHSALTAHFQCGNPTLPQGEKEFMSCVPLHSLPFRLTCRCWTSRSLVFLKSYPHQLVLFLKPLRLLLRSVAVEITRALSARWSGMSGRLANPTKNKGNEPNFYSYLNEEHTSINFPDSFHVTTPPSSQLPKILKFLTREHPAAAREPQPAEFPPC